MGLVHHAITPLILLVLGASVAKATVTATFQQGVNGYSGAFDTTLSGGFPNTIGGNAGGDLAYADYPQAGTTDPNQMGGDAMLCLPVFGNSAGQIPLHSTIISASLTLVTGPSSTSGPGHGGTFHRMLQPWNASSTTNSLGGSLIQANDVQAASAYYFQAGNSSLSPKVAAGPITFSCTTDMQLWAAGAPDYGWAVIPWTNGTDGWGFYTSEFATISDRPLLSVTYIPAPEPASALLLGCGALALLSRRRRSGRVAH